jgi:hypothetical protein
LGAGLAAFGTHRDPLTDRPLTGPPVSNFGKQLTKGLPQVVFRSRLKGASADQSTRLYPMSRKTALEQFALGSAAPKPMNRGKFLSLGEAEKRSAMTRLQRIRYDHATSAQTLLTLARERWPGILPGGKLPALWRQAIDLHQQRALAYEQAWLKHGTPGYQRGAYNSDIDLLAQLGKITPAQAKEAKAWSAKADAARLATQRRHLGQTFFGGAVLSYVKHALKERGGDVSKLPW